MDEYLRLTPSPSGAVSERMQALLSRAVEDQVNEQREVQSLLAEVRNALAEVQRDTRVSPGGSADLRADLANHSSETRAQLSLLDERLEALVRAVSTSAQVLQGLSGQLERVSEAVRERAVEAGRTEPIAQVRHEVADLRTKVDGMEAVLQSQVSALGERLAAEVESLRDLSAASTERVANHVDNAVLVLAEALLRRPVGPVTDAGSDESAVAESVEPQVASQEDLLADAPGPEEPADELEAEPEPVPEPEPEPEEPEPVSAAETVDEPTPASAPVPPRIAVGPVDIAAIHAHDADAGTDAADETPGDALAYDDVISDIPVNDDAAPVFPQFEQAPYDLERALFGDRSRVFVAAETPAATIDVDVEEGSPPEEVAVDDDGAAADVPQEGAVAADNVDAGEQIDDTVRRSDVFVAYDDESAEVSDEDDDDDEPPRRRPWWRAST